MRNLRICLVTGQYPPQIGGVGHSAHRVANLLANQGLDVHVVVLQKHPEQLAFDESFSTAEEGKVIVHRVKVFHPVVEGEISAEVLTRYNREMFEALSYFQREYGYAIMHGFFLYPAGFIATTVARLHGVKSIVSIRGNDVGKYAFDPLRFSFIVATLEQADYVTSVATKLIELADRCVTPIARKAETILNSVDLSRLKVQSTPELNLNGIVIGTAGLIRYKKGLRYLFRALSQLNGAFQLTLLLAGDFFKEEDRDLHIQYLRDYGLTDRTIITGRIPAAEMADYLQLFDILVFPSLFAEGCPLSMLEAMAMKKAIVATPTGAIPEIIQDRENGLIVDSGSARAIANATLELVENPALRERLANRAFETAKNMSPEGELQAWLGVYDRVAMGVHLKE